MRFIPFQIISVFTDHSRGCQGNPAACVYLESPMSETEMNAIARQLKMPATSFIWQEDNIKGHVIRWFAPDGEIDLCGHGSAAAAVYLGARYNTHEPIPLTFKTGEMAVSWNKDETFSIELESIPIAKEIQAPTVIQEGLGIPILGMYETENKHLILTDRESSVKNMQPDFPRLRESEIFGYAITAPGDSVDFVSRTLVPHVLQLEDHATGSSHAILVPFWANRLEKNEMTALQLSPRGGAFHGSLKEGKVVLTGKYEILNQGTVSIG